MRRSIQNSSRRLAVPLALAMSAATLTSSCGFGGGGVSAVRTSFNKGVYHYSQGHLDEAIAEYRAALEENESDRHARFNLAVALEAKARRAAGDPDAAAKLERQAEAEYRTLVEKNPEFLRAIVNLAACEYDRGERVAARSRLVEATERFDGAALPRVALATLEFRTLLDEVSSGPATRAAFEAILGEIDAALDRDPASVQGNMLRGEVHAELARRARGSATKTSVLDTPVEAHVTAAREAYERALSTEPSDIATLMALGRLEFEADRWGAAAAVFERVTFIDPDHFEARLGLSDVLTRMGDLEGATYNLWRARSLDRSETPRLSNQEYRRRLIALYEQLALKERGTKSTLNPARDSAKGKP